MPLVSIIVPVYNVKKYLPKCLDSLINQTLADIEIILVDDGSFDGSEIICDEYASKDNRIKVIHKQNEGLSAARNDGIAFSNAPYIMFADSDDWVEPEFCGRPYSVIIENSADLVLFTYNRIKKNGQIVPVKTKMKDGLLHEDEALFFCIYIWDGAWIGIYRRELFDSVNYPVGKLYEDVGTTHRIIHTAKKICLLNDYLYNYRADRDGSITTDPITKEHPDRKKMHLRRIQDLCGWGYEDLVRKKALNMLIMYGTQTTEQQQLISIVQKKKIEDLSIKLKIMLCVLKISPRLFELISKVAEEKLLKEFYYSEKKQ